MVPAWRTSPLHLGWQLGYSLIVPVLLRRVGSWLALGAFVASTLLPASLAFHAPDDSDAAWGAPGLLNGHPITQFEAVLPTVPDQHCAICHWMRALEHSVSGQPARGPDITLVRLTFAPLASDAPTGIAADSPARAPPTLLT